MLSELVQCNHDGSSKKETEVSKSEKGDREGRGGRGERESCYPADLKVDRRALS